MRIVSLLGSATEIVHALGLEEHLVGISHECDYPPEALALPRLSRTRFDPAGLTSGAVDAAVRQAMVEHGSVYEVDAEALADLRPTLVLTQALCEVCAVPTGSVEAAVARLPEPPRVVSLDAHSIPEILDSIQQVADAAGEPNAGDRLREHLQARLDGVAASVSKADRPRSLLLEWLDPPFSPGHWVPEMIEAAGGEVVLGSAGKRSREVDWESLDELDPDVLLIEPCGYGLTEAERDAERHRERLTEVAARPFRDGRAWVLHSAFFSRSGPRIVDGVEALARVLHPERFAEPPSRTVARLWH